MSEDPDVPITINSDETPGGNGEVAPGLSGPQVRENVDAGADVIDLTAMIKDFEANPDARRRP